MEKTVNYTTPKGNNYSIQFELFDKKNLDSDIDVDIIDLSITLTDEGEETNDLYIINQSIKVVNEYLSINNNVVVYYYCDHLPIKMRKNRIPPICPQEFRSNLFSMMYTKHGSVDYIHRNVKLNDHTGDHYIGLITRNSNLNHLENIVQKLNNFVKQH